MKINVPATFLSLKRKLTVNHAAYDKALMGGTEKVSACDIYCIPQQQQKKINL